MMVKPIFSKLAKVRKKTGKGMIPKTGRGRKMKMKMKMRKKMTLGMTQAFITNKLMIRIL